MDHESFLKTIAADPSNDACRLVFADWLEERGDPYGEFIRVQIELARMGTPPVNLPKDMMKHVGGGNYRYQFSLGDDGLIEMPPIGTRVNVLNIIPRKGNKMMHNLLVVKRVNASTHTYLLKRDAQSVPYPTGKWKKLRKRETKLFGNCTEWVRSVYNIVSKHDHCKLVTTPRNLKGKQYPRLSDFSNIVYDRGCVARLVLSAASPLDCYLGEIFLIAPIESVRLREVRPLVDVQGRYIWTRGHFQHTESLSDLPPLVFDRLSKNVKGMTTVRGGWDQPLAWLYESAEDAWQSLDEGLVDYGRQLAGLPPISR